MDYPLHCALRYPQSFRYLLVRRPVKVFVDDFILGVLRYSLVAFQPTYRLSINTPAFRTPVSTRLYDYIVYPPVYRRYLRLPLIVVVKHNPAVPATATKRYTVLFVFQPRKKVSTFSPTSYYSIKTKQHQRHCRTFVLFASLFFFFYPHPTIFDDERGSCVFLRSGRVRGEREECPRKFCAANASGEKRAKLRPRRGFSTMKTSVQSGGKIF